MTLPRISVSSSPPVPVLGSGGGAVSPPRWERTGSEGESWWVEIETDCFNAEDGPVVSIWTENEDPNENDGKPVLTLVAASSSQAREMAVHLVKCAEALEARAVHEAALNPAAQEKREGKA